MGAFKTKTTGHRFRKRSNVNNRFAALTFLSATTALILLLRHSEFFSLKEQDPSDNPSTFWCALDMRAKQCVLDSGLPLPYRHVCKIHKSVQHAVKKGVAKIGSIGAPHILHQSWKNDKLPDKFKDWSNSWRRAHLGWSYRLWTDDTNRALISLDFPRFLDSYDLLPKSIMRADVVRYLYLFQYGGVYADLDTWCLRDISAFTDNATALVAEMGKDKKFKHNIPNAWLASAEKHPFWLFLAEIILGPERWWMAPEYTSEDSFLSGPEYITGPVIMKQALEAWNCLTKGPPEAKVSILPPGYIYVFDWHDHDEHLNFEGHCEVESVKTRQGWLDCLKEYPNAHVLTYWSHTWG